MTTTINADSSNGFKVTADTSSILALQTNGTTAISIDASQAVSFTNSPTVTGGTANGVAYLNGSKVLTTGSALVFDGSNLGVGVTPSAWSGFKVLESTSGNSVYFGSSQASLGSNAYNDGAGWKYKTTAPAGLFTNVQGSYAWYNAASGTAGNAITFTQAMTLDASGFFGVGTTSPASYGVITGYRASGTASYIVGVNGGGCQTAIGVAGDNESFLGTLSNNVLRLATNGTERARIDTSGNLLVGTTSNPNSCKIAIGPTASNGISIESNSTSVVMSQLLFRNPNGIVGSVSTAGSTTTYATSSDYRLKNTIAPMTGALGKVALLKPVTYKWNADGSDSQGFIAHELAEVCPQAVVGEKDAVETQQYEISPSIPATFDEDGNELTPAIAAVMGEREVPKYQGIDTSFLVATLTAAIQEQQALITQLQADVAALKGA